MNGRYPEAVPSSFIEDAPTLRAGTDGLFYLSGIAFDRAGEYSPRPRHLYESAGLRCRSTSRPPRHVSLVFSTGSPALPCYDAATKRLNPNWEH